jgi:hypothetical protein
LFAAPGYGIFAVCSLKFLTAFSSESSSYEISFFLYRFVLISLQIWLLLLERPVLGLEVSKRPSKKTKRIELGCLQEFLLLVGRA